MKISDDEFARLFQYIEDFRTEVREQMERKADKEDIDRIINLLDATSQRLSDHDIEIAALVEITRRHEDNLETLAGKLKVTRNAAKA